MLREAVIAAALVAPALALADPADAEQRFQKGIAAYQSGDFASALDEFKQAYALSGRWEILFNIGVTAKAARDYRGAVDAFDQYLHDGADAIPADRRTAVKSAEDEIHGLVAEVTVAIDGAPAQLEVDDHHADPTRPLLLAPGHHKLVATRDTAIDRKDIDVHSLDKLAVALVPHAPVTTARLTVRSVPDRASLSFDDHPLGPTPWSGTVEQGGHTLVATLPGRERVRQEISVVAGQDRDYTLELPELPRPWYRHWYVYAGIGVVAAAGAVLYLQPWATSDVVIHYP